MDPLSEVLSNVCTQRSYFAGLKAGGDWAIDFPAPEGIKFNAVMRGQCWLTVEGEAKPIQLQEGDCFLLSRRRTFSLCSTLGKPAIAASEIYRHASNGVATCGTGDAFFLIGGRFTFGDASRLLSDALPPVAVIHQGSDNASVLSWALERLAVELAGNAPGSELVIEHLGHLMLVQVLRLFLNQEDNRTPSWLLALSDQRLGPVINAIHRDPGRRWTVAALADVAAISRSTLALRFKQMAGVGPLEYVLQWRMQLASRALRNGAQTVSAIAETLGYDSDSAFSNAFKRVMQTSPTAYRKSQRTRPAQSTP